MAGVNRRSRAGVKAIVFGAVSGVAWATALAAAPPEADREAVVARALGVAGASVQRLTLQQHSADALTTSVLVGGQPWTMDLQKHSVRAADFRVLVQSEAGGPLVPVPAPPVRTFRGTIRELPGARVTATVVDGQLSARVMTSAGEYAITPMTAAGLTGTSDEHAVYRVGDAVSVSDGVPSLVPPRATAPEPRDSVADSAAVGASITDIAIDSDVEFYLQNGGSIEATVLAIDTLLDAVDGLFDSAMSISYELTAVIVRTAEPDAYTAGDIVTLLCQFQFEWNNGTKTFIRRDVTHLLTARTLTGVLRGAAFPSTVCNVAASSPCSPSANSAYSASESLASTSFNTRVARMAHELGRNWSATNCDVDGADCHIMCSQIGGCGGIDGPNLAFEPRAISEIVAFRESRTCLTQRPLVRTLPYTDSFSSAVVDSLKWTYNDGGTVVTTAIGEPSEPNSLQLSAYGPEEFRDHDIRSNMIRLAAAPDQVLEYYTEHRGPGNGEALVVEFWSSELLWRTLNTIVSDGVDETTFTKHAHVLPATAKHDDFRIRFRTQVDATTDRWFIDDIRLTPKCSTDPDCADGVFCNGVETCLGGICQPGGPPCLPGATCDEVNDSCPAPCTTPAQCADGLFCNGTEVCSGGFCGAGAPPCVAPNVCDEAGDRCVRCLVDADCNDGLFCNGSEVCTGNQCFSAPAAPCGGGQSCDEVLNHCFSTACATPSAVVDGCRYIGVTPAAGVDPVGINLAPLCNVDQVRYVTTPTVADNFAEASSNPAAAAFRTPAEWAGSVHVMGTDVIPNTAYAAWANCGSVAAPVFSQAVNVTTAKFGDAAGQFVDGAWMPPDGSVDVSTDILAILDRFVGQPFGPPKYRVDIVASNACKPDQIVDILDLVAALDGFRGIPYVSSTRCASPCGGAN